MQGMDPRNGTDIISASMVPVVVISACGLLCLAFYNRLASIVSRMRGFHRERLAEQEKFLELVQGGLSDSRLAAKHERILRLLETQTERVNRRARLVRLTLMCLLGAILMLTLCSLAMGLSAIERRAIYVAVLLFLLGMLLLAWGVGTALLEMKDALEPVELEASAVAEMERAIEDHVPRPGRLGDNDPNGA